MTKVEDPLTAMFSTVSISQISRRVLGAALGLVCTLSIVPNAVQANPSPKERYNEAIRDAAVAEPTEQVADLIPLTPDNPNLVWHPDRQRLLMVTWKSQSSFDRFIKPATNSSSNENQLIWVTAAPQVQQLCRQYRQQNPNATEADLKLRLQQYLGLDPAWNYDVFVEMWVDVRDLFRPCADPEVSDRQCQADFPQSLAADLPKVAGITPRSGIANYQTFFKGLYYRSIRTNLQPFTGLGYTYDWGNPNSEVGASEFILVPGAAYTIERAVPTGDYCKPN